MSFEYTQEKRNFLKEALPTIYDKLSSLSLVGKLQKGAPFKSADVFTNNGIHLIKTLLLANKEILWVEEKFDYDGYDKYGPKNKYYELYLITKENDEYHYYFYCNDDIYSEGSKYELYSHKIIK
jgi:hypothetical protein